MRTLRLELRVGWSSIRRSDRLTASSRSSAVGGWHRLRADSASGTPLEVGGSSAAAMDSASGRSLATRRSIGVRDEQHHRTGHRDPQGVRLRTRMPAADEQRRSHLGHVRWRRACRRPSHPRTTSRYPGTGGTAALAARDGTDKCMGPAPRRLRLDEAHARGGPDGGRPQDLRSRTDRSPRKDLAIYRNPRSPGVPLARLPALAVEFGNGALG